MEEQIHLLRRIDERQAATGETLSSCFCSDRLKSMLDVSMQPLPQVAFTSSSTWGALFRSRIMETIQPKVERWRSGLDALLVFVSSALMFPAMLSAKASTARSILCNCDSLSGSLPAQAPAR